MTVLTAAAPDELLAQLPAGNLCILGGPGSGKTTLLEALLIEIHTTHQGRGRLLVPTAGAARAATQRLLAASPARAAADLAALRWPRLTAELVLRYHDLLAYRGTPRPLSGTEQWSLVRSLLLEGASVDWGPLGELVPTRGFTDDLAHFLLACQRHLIGSGELAARAEAGDHDVWRRAAAFYAAYEERLALEDSVDEAGLVVQAGDLLERHPEVLAETAARLGAVLVDDAQTLDPAQLRLLRLLTGGGVRVVLAGDPAGPTDAGRGATVLSGGAADDAAGPTGTLTGRAAALGAQVVVLPGSHRLSGAGLAAVRRLQQLDRSIPAGDAALPLPLTLAGPGEQPATHLAAQPNGHPGGGHPGEGPGDGNPTGWSGTVMEVLAAPSRAEEAEAIARLLRLAHQRDQIPYRRMAVLLPARGQTGPVRHAMDRLGVPYRLGAGEGSLLAEPVIRHTLDLLRLAASRHTTQDTDQPARSRQDQAGGDRTASTLEAELLPGLLTSPLGGLDSHEIRALRRAAVVADQPLERLAADPVASAELPGRLRRRLAALRALIDRAAGRVDREATECFWWLWRTAPAYRRLVRHAETGQDAAVQRQLDALAAFSRTLARFVEGRPGASMRTFLDVAERAEDAADRGAGLWPPPPAPADAVAVLSVGAAKELPDEPDLVVVAGCLDGAVPRTAHPAGVLERWRLDAQAARDLQDPVARATLALDAERRRFTVAASRARRRTVFTYAPAEGRTEPSRLLTEAGLPTPDLDQAAPEPTLVPLTPSEGAGALRRILTDPARPAPDRVAAAANLAALPGADPATWWWTKDWTHDPEPIAPDGSLRTSYSRISSYEDCHLRYYYSSVAGLDDQTSYRMAFGKLMHTIFELAAKGEIGSEPADLKAAFRERFDPSLFPSRAVAHQFWRDGLTMLRYWYEGEAELARRAALAHEVSFEIEVGRHVLRGRIDRVDRADTPAPDGSDGIVLLDYKTSRAIPTEAETAASLQLAIYYLAALRDPNLAALGVPVEMQLVFPAEQRQRRFRRVAQRPGDAHGEQVERRLLPLLEGAAAERFDPNPHADCRYCAFKTICPMWPQGEDFLAPPRDPLHLGPEGSAAASEEPGTGLEGPGAAPVTTGAPAQGPPPAEGVPQPTGEPTGGAR